MEAGGNQADGRRGEGPLDEVDEDQGTDRAEGPVFDPAVAPRAGARQRAVGECRYDAPAHDGDDEKYDIEPDRERNRGLRLERNARRAERQDQDDEIPV